MYKKIILFALSPIWLLLSSDMAFSWGGKTHAELSNQAINVSQLSEYLDNSLGFSLSSRIFLGPSHSETAKIPMEFGPERTYTAEEWIIHGSEAEDEFLAAKHYIQFIRSHDMRAVNHFYNPFWDNQEIYPYPDDGSGNDWNYQTGGLYDDLAYGIGGWDIWMGKPSLRWAYDGSPETPPYTDFTRSDDNYFSWVYARKYFYAALTGDSTELGGIGGIVGKVNMTKNERDRCYALVSGDVHEKMT
jgi:hypothetical protein